jgi:hypothetical protein
LEWIPLKAMRKERDRRYESASALAAEIQNYLHGRPLTAGPESSVYRARKAMRRHRVAVLVSAGVLALTAVCILFVWRASIRAAVAETARQKDAEYYRNLLSAFDERDHENAATTSWMLSDLARGNWPSNVSDDEKKQIGIKLEGLADEIADDMGVAATPRVDAQFRSHVAERLWELKLHASSLNQRRRVYDVFKREGESSPNALVALDYLATYFLYAALAEPHNSDLAKVCDETCLDAISRIDSLGKASLLSIELRQAYASWLETVKRWTQAEAILRECAFSIEIHHKAAPQELVQLDRWVNADYFVRLRQGGRVGAPPPAATDSYLFDRETEITLFGSVLLIDCLLHQHKLDEALNTARNCAEWYLKTPAIAPKWTDTFDHEMLLSKCLLAMNDLSRAQSLLRHMKNAYQNEPPERKQRIIEQLAATLAMRGASAQAAELWSPPLSREPTDWPEREHAFFEYYRLIARTAPERAEQAYTILRNNESRLATILQDDAVSNSVTIFIRTSARKDALQALIEIAPLAGVPEEVERWRSTLAELESKGPLHSPQN